MTRSRASQTLNNQNQLHGWAHVVEAETGDVVIAKTKQLPNCDVIHLSDSNGVAPLAPTELPDPIFGYPSLDWPS